MSKDEAMKLALDVLKSSGSVMGYEKEQQYLKAIKALEEALKQEQKRPQNCGTSYCSCIECVMEQEQGEPTCPSCSAIVLYECVACSSNNYPEGFVQPKQEQGEPTCKTHPDAPHGFVRNASHSEDRYVCECEFWQPPKQEQGELVAWAMLHDNGAFIDAICPEEHARIEGEYTHPLYTTPQQRKPLTEEQIRTQFCGKPENFWDYYAGVRYAEAAHDIKE